MRKSRIMLSLVLALLLALSTVCTAAYAEDEVTITVLMPHFGGIPTETAVHQAWEAMMCEKLDAKITFDFRFVPWGEFSDKVKLALAADDFPDLIYGPDVATFQPYEDQSMFVNLSEYKELIPNYLSFVDKTRLGRAQIENADGDFFWFRSAEIPRLSQGIGIYTPAAYRYDTFVENNIKIPETIDEFYNAAVELKALYPDSYPVAYSNGLRFVYHTNNGLFWDGSEFVYGPVTENYRDMLSFYAKLYDEGLLDPESFTYNDDTRAMRALNGSNFMQVSLWFNTIVTWNNNAESEAVWVNAVLPTNEDYGTAWQNVDNVNEYALTGHPLAINVKSENRELLISLCDLQYTDSVVELFSWGIEGQSFIRDENGDPTFIDDIKNAEDPWKEGDKYGMRASSSYRPGLQLCTDTKAYIDFAPLEPSIINGEYVEVSWEEAFPNENFPNSDMIHPKLFAPKFQFTTEESQAIAVIETAISTLTSECEMKFIRGELNLEEDWEAYVAQVESFKLDTWLEMYNSKVD